MAERHDNRFADSGVGYGPCVDPVLLITNASAGSGDADAVREALDVLRAAVDVEVASTANPGELDGVLHRRGGRRVVVAGGDGSLHAVVAALHRRNELPTTPLALVPLGTGNDFAQGVGIPLDTTEAAHLAAYGKERPVDLLVDALGTVVVNAVHVGVGAQAGHDARGWKKWLGRLGYPIGAVQALLSTPGLRLVVQADGETVCDFDRPVLQVAVANGSQVGSGAKLAPDAMPDDGCAHVIISYAVGPLARLGYSALAVLGKHTELADVVTVGAERVRVMGQPFLCSADGELTGPITDQEWHIEPGVLQLVLP